MAEQFLATNIFPGDGSTTLFNISFKGNRPDAESGTVPYLNSTDVKAQVVTPATADTPEQVVDVALTYVGPNQFSIASPVPVGKNLRIYRATQDEYSLVDYQSLQTVSEADLDLSNRQLVFIMQESHDLSIQAVESAADANTIAAGAVESAEEANDTADEALSIANTALAASSAATSTASSAVGIANTALSEANEAQDKADDAKAEALQAQADAAAVTGTAAAAVTTANTALSTANDAKTTADGIAGTASTALSTAEDAVDTANGAVTTANDALDVANGIDAKAQDALDTADGAVTTANGAEATANSALAIASGIAGTAEDALDVANAVDAAAVKTFNGRTPVSGAINPMNGDYEIGQITNSNDAARLSMGVLPQGRLSGFYPIYVLGWMTPRTINVTKDGSAIGSVAIQGTSDVTLDLTDPVGINASGITYSNSWAASGYFVAKKLNGVVYINGALTRAVSGITIGQLMATLPVGYRPAAQISFLAYQFHSSPAGWGTVGCNIKADGTISYDSFLNGTSSPGGTATVSFNMSYPAA